MKPYINWLYLLVFPLFLFLHACKDRPILDDCFVDTSIIIEPTTLCAVPCIRTFRLRDVEGLPAGVRYNWTLTHNAAPISLDDSAAPEFTIELTEGGNYLVAVALTFDFAGCDITLDRSFTLGVDPPVAIIRANQTECIVGECEIVFTHENENADTWFWSFPGDPNNHLNENEVTVSFNAFPDTFQVFLTAENLSDSTRDSITIIVRPKTFTLDSDDGEDLSNVLCIKENADGSFNAIGNNNEQSYSLKISRSGDIDLSSLVFLDELPSVYTIRSGLGCRQIDDTYIAYGNAVRGSNQDAYLAAFNENFVGEAEVTHFSVNDGAENISDIAPAIGGGYIACGRNSAVNPIGMLLLKLNTSFGVEDKKVLFTGSFLHQATGIINMGTHYIVCGVANNLGNLEGVYFKLSPQLSLIANSTIFLGSDFTPSSLLKIDNDNFVILGENGNTAKIKLIGLTPGDRDLGNTKLAQAMITTTGQLALAGYTGNSASKKPLLMVLDLPALNNNIIVNQPYPVPGGEFFCISQTADNGFVLGGTIDGTNGKELLVIRTDRLGNL